QPLWMPVVALNVRLVSCLDARLQEGGEWPILLQVILYLLEDLNAARLVRCHFGLAAQINDALLGASGCPLSAQPNQAIRQEGDVIFGVNVVRPPEPVAKAFFAIAVIL